LVHRTSLATDSKEFALQILRNQINQHVYPCHRLDRKTSGALLFAKSPEANSKMQKCFADNEVSKTYLAIVRGFTDENGIIDYPLKTDNGKFQEAITHYNSLAKIEVIVPFGKHTTSRYSLVEVKPQTGRMHQIRKHFAHILHPIIGDRPHGCNKQNKLFKEKWNMSTMLLHASSLEFTHPFSGESINIQAPLSPEFTRMLKELNLP
ncbi:MAG TPA: pseudouridine synthase, partial [Bacteroidales bacterium]|nr:pseudouridine synthase [Bacteroidales bacterium]